jgi:predicted cobalt transporter CbtA
MLVEDKNREEVLAMPESAIVAIIVVFIYLGWRRYLEHQHRMAALRHGGDPAVALPWKEKEEKPQKPRDFRVAGLVWMAIGAAYLVAILVSVENAARAMAAGIWGLVPFAVGVSLYLYQTHRHEEGIDDYRRSALVLSVLGLTYFICVGVSVGSLRGTERALQAGIWGLVPLAIGLVLCLYNRILRRERLSQQQFTEPGKEA